MKDILDALQALQSTPVPALLTVAGLVFLLLAFVGKISTLIELPEKRQRSAVITGALLLFAGIGLFILPGSPSGRSATQSIPLADMRCTGEESGATVDGLAVPVSDWLADCAYSKRLNGETVILTTWGLLLEYVDSNIVKAAIIAPNTPVKVPSNAALFAGYQSRDGAEAAYRTAYPKGPVPLR